MKNFLQVTELLCGFIFYLICVSFNLSCNVFSQDFKGRTAMDWAADFRDLQQYIAAYSYGATGPLVAVPGAANPLIGCKYV